MYTIENYQNEHFEEGKKWTGEYSQDFTNWALRQYDQELIFIRQDTGGTEHSGETGDEALPS